MQNRQAFISDIFFLLVFSCQIVFKLTFMCVALGQNEVTNVLEGREMFR
jgi:hypothetical protein